MKNNIARFKLLGAALLFCALSLGSAKAALITLNFNFTATGFGAGAPFNPVMGGFSVTFNNVASITNSAALTAMINIPAPGGIRFSYDQTRDLFILGGALNGADQATAGTDDFLFVLGNVSTGVPTFGNTDFVYTTASTNVGFFPQNITLSAVPDEASSLGLLAVACVGLVSLQQLRRRTIA